jgi:hypothetical protein
MLRNLALCGGLVGIILLLNSYNPKPVGAHWSPIPLISSGNKVLQVKKDEKRNCTKLMVCDYFAPATWCSSPPCCKKWHFEKYCP